MKRSMQRLMKRLLNKTLRYREIVALIYNPHKVLLCFGVNNAPSCLQLISLFAR